jgi:hypothetical protein
MARSREVEWRTRKPKRNHARFEEYQRGADLNDRKVRWLFAFKDATDVEI